MSAYPTVPHEPRHPKFLMPPLDFFTSRYGGLGNKTDAPAHLLLLAGVRGLAHMFNLPVEHEYTGRPKRRIWMPMFVRHMTNRDDGGKTWLRLAQVALHREHALPETLAAVEALENEPFDRPLMYAFADLLESV